MRYLSILFGIFTCLLLSSCTNNGGGGFPQIANPPPFDYPDGEELRSRMHQLAFSLQRLDNVLSEQYDEQNEPSQDAIVDNLRDIERVANTLQEGDLKSQHPFLLDEMANFIADVERAEWAASRGRYYMAGRVAGSCVSCHQGRY